MTNFLNSNVAEGYKQASLSVQKTDGEMFIQTDVCPQAGDAILDLGCGTGDLAALVGPEGKVIGVDPDKERIQLARKTHSDIKNISFVEGSASNFPGMGAERYDIIFCNAALHWIPEKEQAFKNMFGSLSEGSKIAFNYLDHLPPFELNAYKELNPENAEQICQMYQCESRAQIEQYALLAGFKITKSYETYSTEISFENEASILKWHWSTTAHGIFDVSLVTKERLERHLAPYSCGKDDNGNFRGIKVKLPVCRLIANKIK